MLFPEQFIDMGINAPKEHQRVISKLTTGLGALYYQQQKISLEPLPRTMLDEGRTSPVPDVLLYDNQRHTTPIIIEVCHTSGVRNDCKKIMRLINEFDYGIEEGFLYHYVAHQWLRYRKGEADLEADQSFSPTLQLDFSKFL
jgi:Uma2 family endonuclease